MQNNRKAVNQYVMKISIALGIFSAIVSQVVRGGFSMSMFNLELMVEMIVRTLFFYAGYSLYFMIFKRKKASR